MATRSKKWGWTLILSGLLALGGGGESTAYGSRFARHTLGLTNEFAQLFTFDLNQDKAKDIVVIEVDRTKRSLRYSVSVFLQASKGFKPAHTSPTPLPDQMMLAGVGRFGFGPGLAILLPGRVEIWPWKNNHFTPEGKQSLSVSSLFPVASGELKTKLTWVADLNNDGQDELLIPSFDGLKLVQDGPGGLTQLAMLSIPSASQITSALRQRYLSYHLPDVRLFDIDGNGWLDVLAFSDDQLFLFRLTKHPRKNSQPDLLLDMNPPKPFDPNKPEDPPFWFQDAKDLNGDGLPDFIFTKNAATESVFKNITSTLIYYGKRDDKRMPPLRYSKRPDQVFASEGFSLPIVEDTNGDGLVDLVQVNVDISFWNAVKGLITRTVSAEAAYFFMDRSGRYPAHPQEIRAYSVKFSLSSRDHQPIATFGRLNGDMLPDLLLSIDKERLGIHYGTAQGVWETEFNDEIKDQLPLNQSRFHLTDLNGDGREDILLTFIRDDRRKMTNLGNTITVLINGGKGR